ncbi:MAG: hypothetical protein GY940_35450 [bacterium]|nr:hypothetical protein [bacterium]
MKELKNHRVKLTMVDLEPIRDNPVKLLEEITKKYAAIDETDLDIHEIYEQREKQ